MRFLTRAKHHALGLLLGSRYLMRLAPGERRLALTFDDGPDPVHTPPVLDLLARHGATATFFVLGDRADLQPALVRRIVEEGHEIANHSQRHRAFASMPVAAQLAEIDEADAVLRRYSPQPRFWFRPPQGRLPLSLAIALARRRHPVAMWSLDSHDYRQAGVAPILARFEERPVVPGDILLFHDDNAHTAEALARLLPAWQAAGYAVQSLQQAGAGP